MMILHQPNSIANVPHVPWKNGCGTTRTLAMEPAEPGLDEFVWRISLADISQDGSFSHYPGIERSIMLWRGDGVRLHSPSWATHSLTHPLHPFTFRGEDAVTCELIGAASSDLNLMVRRGAISGHLLSFEEETIVAAPLEDLLVLCAAGAIEVTVRGQSHVALAEGHFVRLSQLDVCAHVKLAQPGSRFVCATMHRRES